MPSYDVHIRRALLIDDTSRNTLVQLNEAPIEASDADAAIAIAARNSNIEGRYVAIDRSAREIRQVTFQRNPIIEPLVRTPTPTPTPAPTPQP